MCIRHCWYYLDNDNIVYEHLKGTVHFKVKGEDIYVDNVAVLF